MTTPHPLIIAAQRRRAAAAGRAAELEELRRRPIVPVAELVRGMRERAGREALPWTVAVGVGLGLAVAWVVWVVLRG